MTLFIKTNPINLQTLFVYDEDKIITTCTTSLKKMPNIINELLNNNKEVTEIHIDGNKNFSEKIADDIWKEINNNFNFQNIKVIKKWEEENSNE